MRTLYMKRADPADSPYRRHEESEMRRPLNYTDIFRPPLSPEGVFDQLAHAPSAISPRAVWKNLRRIRDGGHDLLFATAPSTQVVLAQWLGAVRGRYVLLCWATAQRTVLHRWLFRRQLGFARRILVNDTRTRDTLIRDWHVPADRVRWVPFGIDTDFYFPAPEPKDTHLLVPGDAVRDEEFVLELARSGLGPVMRGIKDAGIRDFYSGDPTRARAVDVRWLRPFSEIRANSQHARAVIIPVLNDREPSGLTALLEGMACGRPCIINEGRTTCDHVEDGVTGFILRGPRDSWLEQTRRILGSNTLLRQVGANARKFVEGNHAIKFVARAWIEACAEPVDGDGRTLSNPAP